MRRAIVASIPLLLVAAVLAAVAPTRQTPAAPERPNFVLILADDLGYGEVGAFGQAEIQTPHIDGLARQGLRFRQFYSSNPLCAPARCSLMTGRHVAHCRVWGNDAGYLFDEDVTVAEVLDRAGYTSGVFGKWGLSWNDHPESFPTNQGFARFFGYLDQRHAHSYFPTFLVRDAGERVPLDNVVPNEGKYGQGDATVEKTYSDDLIADEALAFVRENKDRRFFLYYAPTVPHINNEGAKAADGGFEVPDLGIYKDRPWPLPKKSYAAMISRLDTNVGRILALLKELDLERNTVVLFTSDNGSTFLKSADDGKTNIVGDWFNGRGPFRGYKYDVYEGGIREPTILRWPGRVPEGGTTNAIGWFPDLLPTFAEMAGAPVPQGVDGRSLAAIFSGGEMDTAERELYWYAQDWPSEAVRAGRWKAVWTRGGTELFDLVADPSETHNVAPAHPEELARLEAIRVRERGERPPMVPVKQP